MNAGGLVIALGLLGASTACNDRAANDRLAPVVRDSLGVSIVENALGELPEWLVDSMAFVSIGSVEGANGQDLISPWSSTRLSTGWIAVSDAGSNQIRLYDAQGGLIVASGRQGDGPGEYALVAGIFAGPADSLIVTDARRSRISVLDPLGVFVRSFELEPIDGRPPRLRGLIGGTVGVFRFQVGPAVPEATGMRRDTFDVIIRALGTTRPVRVGRFPAGAWFDEVSHDFYSTWFLPFGSGLFTAVSDSLLWIGVSNQHQIQGYGVDGTLRRIIRFDSQPRRVTNADKDQFFRYQLAHAENESARESWQRARRLIAFPSAHPVFEALKADPAGHIWVKAYDLPWAEGPSKWRVFREDGTGVAVAYIPRDLEVHEIGLDYILGQVRDSSGIPYIHAHALRRR